MFFCCFHELADDMLSEKSFHAITLGISDFPIRQIEYLFKCECECANSCCEH